MIETGRPPLPQQPTKPVICILPLIWKLNATTDALGLRQPLTGADGLAQHQEYCTFNRREDPEINRPAASFRFQAALAALLASTLRTPSSHRRRRPPDARQCKCN